MTSKQHVKNDTYKSSKTKHAEKQAKKEAKAEKSAYEASKQ